MQQSGGLLLPPVQKLVASLIYSTPVSCSRKDAPRRVGEIICDDEIPCGDEIRLGAGRVDLISSTSVGFICTGNFNLAPARIPSYNCFCAENGIPYSNKSNPFPLGHAQMAAIELLPRRIVRAL